MPRKGPVLGPKMGPKWVKSLFSKSDLEPFGNLKQVFLACFQPKVTRFGARNTPKFLENGPLWEQKWVKNGSKVCFSKNDVGRFGMLQRVFLAHFEPGVTHFGPWKPPKSLEKGPFWDPTSVFSPF